MELVATVKKEFIIELEQSQYDDKSNWRFMTQYEKEETVVVCFKCNVYMTLAMLWTIS